MNALKDKYRRYEDSQCSWTSTYGNPDRCSASQQYVRYVNKFADDAIKESVANTKTTERKQFSQRLLSEEHKRIFPLVNHDFNYQTYARRNYNPYHLGITTEPTTSNFNDATSRLGKFGLALSSDPFPGNEARAGVHDIIPEDSELVSIKQTYQKLNETLPYPTFRQDYPEQYFPTTGKHASSYFLRTGTCPTRIRTEEECLRKGYEWTPSSNKGTRAVSGFLTPKPTDPNQPNPPPTSTAPEDKVEESPKGACAKPRFSYIDNSSKGSYGSAGLVPAMMNDIMNLSPTNLLGVLAGYTVEGSGLLPCIEEFTTDSYSQTVNIAHSFIVVGLLIAWFVAYQWVKLK